MLTPDRMPVQAGKNIANILKKFPWDPLQLGNRFSTKISPAGTQLSLTKTNLLKTSFVSQIVYNVSETYRAHLLIRIKKNLDTCIIISWPQDNNALA